MVPASDHRLSAIPDRCPHCQGTISSDAPFPRILCLNCGWDAYIRNGHGLLNRSQMMGSVFAALLVCLMPVMAWADGGRYVSIADNALSTTAEEICPAAGNRIGCTCTNTDSTIHMRIGDSAITTTRGVQLRAGTSGTFTSPFSISAIAESGTPTIACTDERRP